MAKARKVRPCCYHSLLDLPRRTCVTCEFAHSQFQWPALWKRFLILCTPFLIAFLLLCLAHRGLLVGRAHAV